MLERVEALVVDYRQQLDALEIRKACQALRALWAEGNVYLEEREPWRPAVKVDRDLKAATLRHALGLVRLYGHLSAAVLPTTAAALTATLPSAAVLEGPDAAALAASVPMLEPGTAFASPGLLFRKVEPDDVAEARFGRRRRGRPSVRQRSSGGHRCPAPGRRLPWPPCPACRGPPPAPSAAWRRR